MGSKNNDKKKGGFGRILAIAAVVVGLGIGAVAYMAPDQVSAQIDALRGMLGL